MSKVSEKKPVKKASTTVDKSAKVVVEKKPAAKKAPVAKASTMADKSVKKTPVLKKMAVPVETKDAKEDKVLKADELGMGWFLSGLGFTKKEERQVAKEEEEKEEEQESLVLDRPHHPTFSFDTVETKKEFTGAIRFDKPAPRPAPRKWPPQRGDARPAFRPAYAGSKPNHGWGARPPFRKPDSSHPVVARPVTPRVVKEATGSANLVKKQEITINETITVKEFSEKMGVPLQEVMKKLLANKIMKWVTASLDFDTAALIAGEFNVEVKHKENKLGVETFMSWDLQAILDLDKEAPNLVPRAPIVTIMGHVDHGKTSLLDYLRKTVVAEGEAGGITQSIWASVVDYNGKKICFIDTPGHELFSSLRARGAKLTNIAVIVIAADDSVMPQTIESIGHAKEAGVPIIIAITKIDKPGNKIDTIKSDIAKYGLTPEDWWGDVPVIGISSKTGQGIPELLEAILLQSEMLDLKYNPKRSAVGVIVDAHKDPKQGVVSTIIVMTGTMKIWDIIVAYNTYGKIRRMQNRLWKSMVSAVGGEPVQILGITSLPEPGRIVEVVKNEKEAQEKIALIQEQISKQSPESAVHQFISQLQSGAEHESELRLVLKSDGSSSLEALKQAVAGIVLPKNVTIKVVHSDVGYFSESDLALAQAAWALLLGFNISMNAILKKKADNMKIEMKNYDIIYELTDYLTQLVQGMIIIDQHEVVVGKLEVLGVFFSKGKDMTVGGKVIEGKVKNKLKFRVLRGEDILCNGDIVSLHRNKDEVKEVGEWEEAGVKVSTGKKIEIGDILEFYEMQDIVE